MNKTKLFFAFLLFFMFVFNNSAIAQETCCSRLVATAPISMPKPQESDCSSFLNGVINMVLTENFAELNDCPIEVEIMDYSGWINANEMMDKLGEIAGAPKDAESPPASKLIEYLFKSSLFLLKIDDVVKGEWETGYEGKPNWVPGNVHGSWELRIDLVDSNRGTVVRSGSTTWSGNCAGDAIAAVTALVNTRFMPLDDIIYDYERIPETASIIPGQPAIEAGTEATFSITETKDQQGRQSAPFQRVLVSVDKGRVVNGFDKDPYKVFEVGPSGTVQIRYRAPDECVDQTATLEVFNSCNINDGLYSTLPEKKLTTSEIQIHCTPKWRWRGTLSLNWATEFHYNGTWESEKEEERREMQTHNLNSATGVISLVTNEGDDQPSVLTESDMKLGGSIFLLRNEFDEQWWKFSKGICKNQVVTPGHWLHKTNSMTLQRTCTLANASLSLSFTDLTPEEAAAVVQEMASGGDASSLLSREGSRGTGSDYVRVQVLLGLECEQHIKYEIHNYSFDCCEGTVDDETPGYGFIPHHTFSYYGWLVGTINRKKNGEVTIEAVGEGAKVDPDAHASFTIWSCPAPAGCPAQAMVRDNTKLVLRRRRIK